MLQELVFYSRIEESQKLSAAVRKAIYDYAMEGVNFYQKNDLGKAVFVMRVIVQGRYDYVPTIIAYVQNANLQNPY